MVLIVTKPAPDTNGSVAAAFQKERASRLLAEMRLEEERQKRLVLERALANVCAELHKRDAIAPVIREALERIEDWTDSVLDGRLT